MDFGFRGRDESGENRRCCRWRSCDRVVSKEQTKLDISSVKKHATLSASETPGAEEGKSEEHLRCSSLLIVC